MTENPDNLPAATDVPTSTERADLLGSTALTARVRCPCGLRQDCDREDWQWFGVALCTRCGRGILHDSLRLVGRREALTMIAERQPTEGEQKALRRMELANRDFLLWFNGQPRWAWSAKTAGMADELRQLVAFLDRSRRERGAPPVVAPSPPLDEAADEEGEPEQGEWGDEEEEYGGDVDVDEEDDDEGEGGEDSAAPLDDEE